MAGTLTNSNFFILGNARLSAPAEVTAASLDNTWFMLLTGSGANQALLDVTGSAGFGTAGVLSGNVQLGGDQAGEFASGQKSAIEFASGQISTIAASSDLWLFGKSAFIEDSTALGSNSALTGLANIAGSLYLVDGASVSTTGALANDGHLMLDYRYGAGGSRLAVAGTLTNDDGGDLSIGISDLSWSNSVTANSFVNSGTAFLTGIQVASRGQMSLSVLNCSYCFAQAKSA